MTDTDARPDWPFGPFLASAIKRSGMSQRAVARAARISEGRLRQLVTGYQKAGGMRVPIATSALTVLNLSDVLQFDPYDGLKLAGLEHAIEELTDEQMAANERDIPKMNPELATYDTGQLMREVEARYEDLVRRVGTERRVVALVPTGASKGARVIQTEDETALKRARRGSPATLDEPEENERDAAHTVSEPAGLPEPESP